MSVSDLQMAMSFFKWWCRFICACCYGGIFPLVNPLESYIQHNCEIMQVLLSEQLTNA